MILRLVASLLLLVCAVCVASASTVTVYAWPLSAASPKPFAEVALPSSSGGVAELKNRKAVTITGEELVRVGLLNSDKSWTGVATSGSSFAQGVSQKLILHTDSDGQVTHVGFSAYTGGSGSKNGELAVEVAPISTGAQPVLNKPIVLNAEGKIATPEKDERGFLQKYWWAIALFLVLQVVAGGGKE